MIQEVTRFLNEGLWETRLRSLSPLKALGVRYLRVLILALRGFKQDECPRRASALTYYSMLNIVPLAAVAFGIAKGFGLEKLVENRILQMAEQANWQSDITNQILTFSRSLLEHTKGGLIAGVGVVLLFWTVISILGKIEDSLNAIWEVKKPRPLVRKFSDYMAMMIFAPILLIISSSLTVLVAGQVKVIVQKISLLGSLQPTDFLPVEFPPICFHLGAVDRPLRRHAEHPRSPAVRHSGRGCCRDDLPDRSVGVHPLSDRGFGVWGHLRKLCGLASLPDLGPIELDDLSSWDGNRFCQRAL